MSILSREQLLEKIKQRVGEDTSDDALSFIEDVSDTIDSYESRTSSTIDWEQKYKENDEAWRKKYRERFFGTPAGEEEPASVETEDDKPKSYYYDNLFKEEKPNA